MSIVQDLIRRSHAQPAELTIDDAQVEPLVRELIAVTQHPDAPSHSELADQIRAGEMKFMALPLRVLTPASRTAST